MAMPLKRTDLQKLARLRLKEAKILRREECYSGAYYLAGYAVECALKACFGRKMKKHVIPDKKLIHDIYTHECKELVRLAELGKELDSRCRDVSFAANWHVVTQWNPEIRYGFADEHASGELLNAITDRKNGVMKWIREHW